MFEIKNKENKKMFEIKNKDYMQRKSCEIYSYFLCSMLILNLLISSFIYIIFIRSFF